MSTPADASPNLVPSKVNTSDTSPVEEVAAVVEQEAKVNEKEEQDVTSSITAKKPEQEQNEIRVVQDEPNLETTTDDSNRRNSAINPSAILETTMEGLATISSKINPITEKLGKGLGQVRQVSISFFIILPIPAFKLIIIISNYISLLKKSLVQPMILLNYPKNIKI